MLDAPVLGLVSSLLAVGPAGAAAAGAPPAAPQPVVDGNRLVDAATDQPLRVAGVNRSGSEYACVQGWGIFDGPVDDASLAAIAAWGTNTVRVPLNEDCWLGINGVKQAYGGSTYRSAIVDLVDRLHAQGLAAILDLHWSAPGSKPATEQAIAPDAVDAPVFWSDVARTFKHDPSVMFELFNEPRDISWRCWRDGCTTSGRWKAAGAQQLVDAVRKQGARQPIIIDGLNWGGDLTGWDTHAPSDPQSSLVAGWHIYDFSGCNTASCWDATAAPVAQRYPVLLTEVGESDCDSDFVEQILPWADAHDIGYLAWSWNTASCSAGPALVSDYAGTPTAFGAGYREHLLRPATAPTGDATETGTDTTDGSETVTPGAPTPLDARALFDFEEGTTEGWATRWGALAVANRAGTAFSGSHGLALTTTTAGYPAVGTDVNLQSVTPGAEVTYRVWAPSGVGVTVSPMVFDPSWRVTVLGARSLAPGWNSVTFSVPVDLAGVRVLGLQVDNPRGWAGTVVLDDVSVHSVRQSFEDGGTSGWSTRWGSLEVWNDGVGYQGSRGLALGVPGAGYPAAGTDQVSGLVPGTTVSMQVWAPSDVDVAVAPMVFDLDWDVSVLTGRELVPGWNTVSFAVPAFLGGVRVVGLQVNDSTGWAGKLVVDAVAW